MTPVIKKKVRLLVLVSIVVTFAVLGFYHDTVKEYHGKAQDLIGSNHEDDRIKQSYFGNKLKSDDPKSQEGSSDETSTNSEFDVLRGDLRFQNYFGEVFNIIVRNDVSFPVKERLMEKWEPVRFYPLQSDVLTEEVLQDFIKFEPSFVEDMTIKHADVVSSLKALPNKEFYKGDGYVIVGGGKYSWYALMNIEALRRTGAELPVEVILPSESDYEFEFCEKILPSLNGRCVELRKVFGSRVYDLLNVKGYQLKSFALLGSSFQNAFLMDSDTFAVTNPDPLFSSDLFKKFTMITWPDFWRRTTSPTFYKIAGIDVGKSRVRNCNDLFTPPKYYTGENNDPYKDIPFHDRQGAMVDWSSESGELLINKKVHFKSLMLSLYYNFAGPQGFYPLLSQGGAGEGDKETFVASAHYYNLPYYQVYKKAEKAFGWFNGENIWEHSSIIQFDPLKDYEVLQKRIGEVKKKLVEFENSDTDHFDYNYDDLYRNYFTTKNSHVMFVHMHDPKMNPFTIMQSKFGFKPETNERVRNMGEELDLFGYDIEAFIWETINKYVCTESHNFRVFEENDPKKLCGEFMKGQLKFLKESGDSIYKNIAKIKWEDRQIFEQKEHVLYGKKFEEEKKKEEEEKKKEDEERKKEEEKKKDEYQKFDEFVGEKEKEKEDKAQPKEGENKKDEEEKKAA
ncbi:unnamed protein product [Kuraishia capsulata CBS 1993]|uniref:Glycosyltransferase family 71 protein n=1 Tax=Kuraishia capsulata CBS 1993 TaxID=1382522 RepID=W6MQJ3_9ASCO|nr:uncharacterized protein KUCA_T00004990001 [Kuraishia capsulata CBS 1993]CDK29004.1 unnamed protein product [Kuraishia capsulata CBS 1993]